MCEAHGEKSAGSQLRAAEVRASDAAARPARAIANPARMVPLGIIHYCRLLVDGKARPAIVRADRCYLLASDPITDGGAPVRISRDSIAAHEARLLAPVRPRTVLAIGDNYPLPLAGRWISHPVPGLYLKPPGAIIDPGAQIVLPVGPGVAQAEGSMVVVIGRRGKHISEADAGAHVFGITCGNDISERIWQRADLQWARARGADGFGPIGPVIAAGLDTSDLTIKTRINGRIAQRGSTADMHNSVATIIAKISRTMTLEPGDVIFTGSPGATPTIKPGDTVEVEIEGVGVLRNRIAWAAAQPRAVLRA